MGADIGPVTDKRVLKIALPIVLSNATVPILGAVDTGVVGQLGEAAPIGAVGLGAIIISFIYWVFGFLRMGTAGLTAQALGAKEDREVTALLIRGLMVAGAVGVAYIILQIPIFWFAFQASPASAEVEGLASDYMQIRIWGRPRHHRRLCHHRLAGRCRADQGNPDPAALDQRIEHHTGYLVRAWPRLGGRGRGDCDDHC